jgi:hypothetical protein
MQLAGGDLTSGLIDIPEEFGELQDHVRHSRFSFAFGND